MSKYVIRNCPAIYGIDDGFLCSYREDDEIEKYCYDCTDCLLKQIVELCRKAPILDADWILNRIDIQEVE